MLHRRVFHGCRNTIRGYPKENVVEMHYTERLRQLTEPGSLAILERRGILKYRHRESDGLYLVDDPIGFYQSNRKGWSVVPELLSIDLIENLRNKGAKYFATTQVKDLMQRWYFWKSMDERYTLLERTSRWAIYRLDKTGKEEQ